jgi:short-subunit dehydrogenase
LRQRYGNGSVAVITGATNDTGFAFAEKLARNGFKLICVAEKDDEKVTKLRELYPGTEVIVFDFASTAEHKAYEQLCDTIRSKAKEMGEDISVLVNNVERMDLNRGKIHRTSDDELLQTVNINTCPAIYMTRILGEHMKKRESKSAIINMSSFYN